MQICFHILKDHIEISVIFGLDDRKQFDDIIVLRELFEEDDFPVGPLGIRRVLECVEHLLEGHDLLRFTIKSLPNYTVGSFAFILLQIETLLNVLLHIRVILF